MRRPAYQVPLSCISNTSVRARRAQIEAIVFAAGGGLLAGAVLWALLSGPAARFLPASWRVPERMAADTLHMDMWAAGGRLMQADNPQAWDRGGRRRSDRA